MLSTLVIVSFFLFSYTLINNKNTGETKKEVVESSITESQLLKVKYKDSEVRYYGTENYSKEQLIKEAKLIDIADRRFEKKWKDKNAKGISEEYTHEGAVFMKPGKKPSNGRQSIENEFSESVKGVDRVSFFQDELEFFGDLTVAFQRCHMLGYVNDKNEHVFEGSYVILWKKEKGEWLIQYDMFNADK